MELVEWTCIACLQEFAQRGMPSRKGIVAVSFLLSLLVVAGLGELDRPVLPQFVEIPASTCEDPAARKEFMSGEYSSKLPTDAVKAYNASWEAYLDARMDQSGMTKEEQASFGLTILESKEFHQIQGEGIEIVRSMMQDLQDILASKDELSNCKSLSHMTTLLPPMLSNAERQWQMMVELLDAEAVKRGK